ncbi:MAG: PEGA domain-containing protein [Deltaproteobacteria bacterium]|nr:PEGA domain-containing protein [Deltaproteobacteria bacterium]
MFGTKNQSRMLYTGSHSITFIPNDEQRLVRETWKVIVPPGKGPFRFGKRLRFRPAKLLVESNVDSVVTVPGRGTGRTNEAFDVNIRSGPEEQVSVLVTAEGYRPRTRRVRISAGEAVRTKIDLEREEPEPAAP